MAVTIERMNGLFMGKVIGSEGGPKKDGSYWRLWKLSFKASEESEHPYMVSKFQNGKKEGDKIIYDDMKEMKEGEWYHLHCRIQPYTNEHGEQKGKTLWKFEEGQKEIPETPIKKEPEGPAVAEETVHDEIDWEDFVKQYDAQSKGATFKHPKHMMGAFVANYHKEQFKELYDKCHAHFK